LSLLEKLAELNIAHDEKSLTVLLGNLRRASVISRSCAPREAAAKQ
jgi:hypothetical protein